MKKGYLFLIVIILSNGLLLAQSGNNIITGELGIWTYKRKGYGFRERHENAATAYYHMLNPNFGLGLRVTALRGTDHGNSSAMRLSTDLVTRWKVHQTRGFRWMSEAGLSLLEEATLFQRKGIGECGMGLSEEYLRRLSSGKRWFHDATRFGLALTNRLEYRLFYDNWIGLSLGSNTYWINKKVKVLFVPNVAVLHGF